MAFDFKNIKQLSKDRNEQPVNPVSLFYKLEHPSIADLYPVQEKVLSGWYQAFVEKKTNTIISLDTGTGKTLVGLLIAKSLLISQKGKVLYVCPNNYLVEQTAEKAKDYGISVSIYKKGEWTNQEGYLQNTAVCITNYDSVYNSKSIFEREELVGCIFDDAHLSLDIIDNQFSVSVERDKPLYNKLFSLLKEHSSSIENLERIEGGDPQVSVLIPLIEWYSKSDQVKKILEADESVSKSFQWGHVKPILKKTLCFLNAVKIEISPLYPNIQHHYISEDKIFKVYLSATLPNRDDLLRILNIETFRIESKNPDYRPERLFVFSKLLKLDDVEKNGLYNSVSGLSKKTLILVPNRLELEKYKGVKHSILVRTTEEIKQKVDEFKSSEEATLVLMNRYDGIDLPGDLCHSLVLDGLPFNSSLKTRFFSEYFHNQKNAFMRSILASKLVQAFGRTVRGYTDYSVVFLLGDKLNKWVLNKDNNKFFREDVVDDYEIGIEVSESINSMQDLEEMTKQMLNQTDEWKKYVNERRKVTVVNDSIDVNKEDADLEVAKAEREIINTFYNGDYSSCVDIIKKNQKLIKEYSRPILGLYLSIGSICSLELKDKRLASALSAQAFGINPLFGKPLKLSGREVSQQEQRIMDNDNDFPDFIWETQGDNFGKQYDEDLKRLGEFLGFTSSRPEADGDGTLDVLWVNEEDKIALGIELKVDKTTDCLSKDDIDQCLGHIERLKETYLGYEIRQYAVCDIKAFNRLASPADLRHFSPAIIKELTEKARNLYVLKETKPESIYDELKEKELTPDVIFPEQFIKKLKTKEQ